MCRCEGTCTYQKTQNSLSLQPPMLYIQVRSLNLHNLLRTYLNVHGPKINALLKFGSWNSTFNFSTWTILDTNNHKNLCKTAYGLNKQIGIRKKGTGRAGYHLITFAHKPSLHYPKKTSLQKNCLLVFLPFLLLDPLCKISSLHGSTLKSAVQIK